jgi:hypothetical protein
MRLYFRKVNDVTHLQLSICKKATPTNNKQTILSAGLKGLLISFITIMTISCDDEPFASQLITFIIPASIEPTDSIVTVGDTLWIMVNASDSLYDYHTNKKYKVPNFNFGQTSIVVRKLVDKSKDLSDQVSAVSHFETISKIGEVGLVSETFVDFKFHYHSALKQYELRLGFVSKIAGIYCIALLSPTNLNYNGVISLGKSNNGATIIPVYEDLFFPVNNGKNNFELFKKFCFDSSELNPGNYRDKNYIQKGTFTFKVSEK